jgi:uncharacterized GH25 family protein
MNRGLSTTLVALFALAVAVGVVGAHDLFIKMDTYFIAPNAAVTVPIINGTFQQSENSITTDRVQDVSVVVAGHRTKLGMDGWAAETDTTFLELRTGDAGTYVIGVSTIPRTLGLDGPDFNQYLAVDGIPDMLIERARDRELDSEAWEEYSKHIKAVFQVGERRSGGLDVVLGYPAELVPLVNPYELSEGDEMVVQALVDSEPVAGQLVLVGGDGDMAAAEGRTDAEGVFSFTLDAPGRWYAKFINMQKTDREGLTHESKWATLSFEIR